MNLEQKENLTLYNNTRVKLISLTNQLNGVKKFFLESDNFSDIEKFVLLIENFNKTSPYRFLGNNYHKYIYQNWFKGEEFNVITLFEPFKNNNLSIIPFHFYDYEDFKYFLNTVYEFHNNDVIFYDKLLKIEWKISDIKNLITVCLKYQCTKFCL